MNTQVNTTAPHRFPGPVWFTAISGKVVGKNVHATIPKGNMGYDQYTVPDTVAVEPFFCFFSLALANIRPKPLVPFYPDFL